MTRQCAYDPTCRRDPVPTSPDGTAHANCAGHEREAMSFFGESWHDQARAGVLRPAIVGGLPLPSSGAVPGVETLSPQGLGHPQSAGAPAAVPVTRHDAPVGARVRPASGGSHGSSSRPDAEAPAAGPSPR